jgi:hypothetical protein
MMVPVKALPDPSRPPAGRPEGERAEGSVDVFRRRRAADSPAWAEFAIPSFEEDLPRLASGDRSPILAGKSDVPPHRGVHISGLGCGARVFPSWDALSRGRQSNIGEDKP